MGDIQVVPWLSRWFRMVSFDSFLHPSKSKRRDVYVADAYALPILFVTVLFEPAIPTSSFNFIVFNTCIIMIMLLAFCTGEGSAKLNVFVIVIPIVVILILIVMVVAITIVLVIWKFRFRDRKEDYHVCEGKIMQNTSTIL